MNEGRDYDRLAVNYHRIFPDWPAVVQRQGDQLDRLIRAEIADRELEVLDCSCGIGTQALGLALHGHRVVASDLSAAAIRRADREADKLGVELVTVLADIRQLGVSISAQFDVVISCDNSVSHLVSHRELRVAVESMRDRLKPGGLLLVSLRDYRRDARGRPTVTAPRVSGASGHRRVVFQLWEWEGRMIYRPDLVILEQTTAGWRVRVYPVPRLRTWSRRDVISHLRAVGLSDVQWRLPAETGYYQPIATGRLSDPDATSSPVLQSAQTAKGGRDG